MITTLISMQWFVSRKWFSVNLHLPLCFSIEWASRWGSSRARGLSPDAVARNSLQQVYSASLWIEQGSFTQAYIQFYLQLSGRQLKIGSFFIYIYFLQCGAGLNLSDQDNTLYLLYYCEIWSSKSAASMSKIIQGTLTTSPISHFMELHIRMILQMLGENKFLFRDRKFKLSKNTNWPSKQGHVTREKQAQYSLIKTHQYPHSCF